MVFVAVILQVALLAYIYANKGNIEKYATSIWSQLTDQSKVDFQKKVSTGLLFIVEQMLWFRGQFNLFSRLLFLNTV